VIADRLKEAPEDVQDTFARGRAALQGLEVNDGKLSNLDEDGVEALREMLLLRQELGWDDE
jgi:hypothetical protein